jgi:hypothetical protein
VFISGFLKKKFFLFFIGTHSVFKEIVDDYECIKRKTEQDADHFMKYQLEIVGHFYDHDVKLIQEEYQVIFI